MKTKKVRSKISFYSNLWIWICRLALFIAFSAPFSGGDFFCGGGRLDACNRGEFLKLLWQRWYVISLSATIVTTSSCRRHFPTVHLQKQSPFIKRYSTEWNTVRIWWGYIVFDRLIPAYYRLNAHCKHGGDCMSAEIARSARVQ